MPEVQAPGEQTFEEVGPVRGPARPAFYKVVDAILDGGHFVQDEAGNVYRWNGRFWAEVRPATLRHLAYQAHGGQPKAGTVDEIIANLKCRVHDAEFAFGRTADHEVAVWNGVVDALTGELRCHTPEDYLENVVQVSYDPAAVAPTWADALSGWFGEEDDRLDALQEFFGYVILPRANFKKALLLFGPGDCGKSVIVSLLRALVGPEFTCSIAAEHMDDPRLLAVIKGKRLNVMSEVSSRALLADGGFKTLVSTEEPVLLDRKYVASETYVPRAKHVIACNDLPKLTGSPDEVFARLLVVPMSRRIAAAEQDPDLPERLTAELPGILNWALNGARRLLAAKGRFTEPVSAAQVFADWEEKMDPLHQWLAEALIKDEQARVPLGYIAQRASQALRRSIGARQVAFRLRRIGLGDAIKSARTRDAGRRSVKCLIGWRFGTPTEDLTWDDLQPVEEPPP